MKALSRVLAGLAGAALLALGAFAYAQHGAVPAPVVSFVAQKQAGVPFELFRGNRVVAAGTINRHPVDFILDTGAGVTTVDREFARLIGLPSGQKIRAMGASGTVEAELVTGVAITLGSLKLDKATVVVIDLASVSKGIGRPVQVILGRELFDNAIVTLDWKTSQMTIAPSDGFLPPAGAKAVKLGRGGDRLNTIPISIGGLPPVNAHLDLGNGSALSLPRGYWESKPELAHLPFANSESGGVGGMHGTRLVILDSVSIAGVTFAGVPATLTEEKNAHAVDQPNAGIGLLKPFRVTMDLGHDRLYLEPLAGPPAFQRDRAGARTEFSGHGLKVSFLSPQGPAAKAGLRKGDLIIAVNGVKVDPDFYRSAVAAWNNSAAGTDVALTLADGRTVRFALADYY